LTTGILGGGLMAGLFYGWAVSVNPGLRRVPDNTYITTMQHINRAIINPMFLIPFLAMPAVLAAASIAQFRIGDTRRGWYLASAAVVYLFGVVGVTVGGNVPLNNALDSFALAEATGDSASAQRLRYETGWVRWHNVRTAASLLSFGLTSAAALIAADLD
jgi:uncharacterized membrane protein